MPADDLSLGGDQAAGLRRWAEQFAQGVAPAEAVSARPAPVTLLVVGVPGPVSSQSHRVQAVLTRWAGKGHRWVGEPSRWKVVALAADSPHLAVLASQQSRWALWVDDDGDAFRRAWQQLRTLQEHDGPRRLLVLHEGIRGHAGLLGNLRQAAAHYLQIELLLLAEEP